MTRTKRARQTAAAWMRAAKAKKEKPQRYLIARFATNGKRYLVADCVDLSERQVLIRVVELRSKLPRGTRDYMAFGYAPKKMELLLKDERIQHATH
jgi:hypothetical protein